MKKALKNLLKVKINRPDYGINVFSVFNKYLLVKGWVYCLNNQLADVVLYCNGKKIANAITGLPSNDINLPGENLRFQIEILVPRDFDRQRVDLTFHFKKGTSFSINYEQIISKIEQDKQQNDLTNFIDLIKKNNCQSIVEIGSRARSGVVRKELFSDLEYVGIDILPGENVDIVGDAHELSSLVKGKKFDSVVSLYTFEHILMPWKVILEINKTLNVGGFGLIITHQTVGMHDLPWDYWRFSDTAWHSLFNKYTGFEIIKTSLSDPMYLVPFIDHGESFIGFEKSAGFYTSVVMFKKISDTNLSWDVPCDQVAIGSYPGN